MSENKIHPKFNIYETYRTVNLVNANRLEVGGVIKPATEIAYFEMENPNNGLVDTYGDYTGTVSGVTSIAGKLGNGFKFNGSSSFATIPSVTMPTEWAIEFWIYKPNFNTQYIVDKNGVNSANRISIYATSAGLVTRVNNTFVQFTYNETIPNHLIMTGSGSTFDAYFNGVSKGQAIQSGGVSGSQNILLGKFYTNQFYLNGWLDEFKIHNKRLTAAEAVNRYETYL